jgi:hypothetical protein
VKEINKVYQMDFREFLNDEINLAGISDAQAYRMAGNGWDINLASKILKNLLQGEVKQC